MKPEGRRARSAGTTLQPGGRASARVQKRESVHRRLLSLLEDQPGLSASTLCRMIGCPWGTLQYHLYSLKDASLLTVVPEGRHRRYFVAGVDLGEARRLAILRRGRMLQVVRTVMERPGLRQTELAKAISMSRKVLRSYIDLLKRLDLMRETAPSLNVREYRPTATLRHCLSRLQREEGPRGLPAAGNTDAPLKAPPLLVGETAAGQFGGPATAGLAIGQGNPVARVGFVEPSNARPS